MFISSGAFNGFLKLSTLSECSLKFGIFLAILEIVGYAFAVTLSLIAFMGVKTFYGDDPRIVKEEKDLKGGTEMKENENRI